MSRKTNKTITAVGMAVLMTAAGVLTAMAAQSPTIIAGNGMSQIEAAGPGVQSPDAEQEQAPIWGSIISADNGSIDMDCPSGNIYEGEVIVNISGDTLILDGENGYPLEAEELQAGETVYVYIGPAMTMSLPPQTTGEVVIGKIPADQKAPEYITAVSMTANADGSWTLVSAAGKEYAVSADCRIMPYLTRQIVSLEDVEQGSNLLVWRPYEGEAFGAHENAIRGAEKQEPQANRYGQRKRCFERRQPGVGVGVGGVCHVDDVLLVQLVCRPMFADDAICGYTRMVSINGVRVASGPCARSHSVEDVTSSMVG